MDHRIVAITGAMAIAAAIGGCKSQLYVTLCSDTDKPVDFVLRFTRAEPNEVSGVVAPAGSTTVKVAPGGDGHYEIELHRDSKLQQHPGPYYSVDALGRDHHDTFTVTNDLGLLKGCTPTGSVPVSK